MSLEERVAEAVRTHADNVVPPPMNVPELLRRARRHRRARAAGVICSAVAVGAVAVAVSIPGDDKRTDPPAVDRPHGDPTQVITRRDGMVVVPDLRDEQVVVTPDINPSDLQKEEELLGSASTTEDEYAGATDLSVNVPVFNDNYRREIYCTGAPSLHYIFTIDPNATYFETGSCGGTAPTTFPPTLRTWAPGIQYSPSRRADPENLEARIFVTDRNPREYKRCYEYSPPDGCDDVEPPQASTPDLAFGVAMYESAPPVLVRMLGYDISGLSSAFNTDYMLDRAVAAPTAASTLSYELAASGKERLVQVLTPTGGELELLVDGERANRWKFGLIGGRGPAVVLQPGGPHEITVAPSAGNSEVVNLGLVVFEAVE